MGIEHQIEQIEAVIEELHRLESIYIPATVKDAGDEKWEAADLALEQIARVYESAHIGRDSQRVVPVKEVLRVLAELEESLVKAMVQDPFDILWGKVEAARNAAKYIWEHLDEIWEGIKEAFDAGTLVEFVTGYLLEIITIAAIKALAKKAMVASDGVVEKMRSRALPQSTGKRIWRKRVARA